MVKRKKLEYSKAAKQRRKNKGGHQIPNNFSFWKNLRSNRRRARSQANNSSDTAWGSALPRG